MLPHRRRPIWRKNCAPCKPVFRARDDPESRSFCCQRRRRMPDSYIQDLFADRIGGSDYGKGTVVYKFEKIRRARDAAVQERPDLALIDMGVGEPDGMAYPG